MEQSVSHHLLFPYHLDSKRRLEATPWLSPRRVLLGQEDGNVGGMSNVDDVVTQEVAVTQVDDNSGEVNTLDYVVPQKNGSP